MRAYFSKQKEGLREVESRKVDIDDELQEILYKGGSWSNITLNDLFESYIRKMSLINHFADQETTNDKSCINKLKQLAKILKEMLNTSNYYVLFDYDTSTKYI